MPLLSLSSSNAMESTTRWHSLLTDQDLFSHNHTSVFLTVTSLILNSNQVLYLPKLNNGQELILSPRLQSSFQSKTRLFFQTEENILTRLWLLTLDSTTLQKALKVSQKWKRAEAKIMSSFTPLTTKKESTETTITVGTTLTEISSATLQSSHTRVKVLTSTLFTTSTS